MSDGMQDKVDVHNIFKPGHGGGGEGGMGGLGTAAVIAAMGNRNETGTAGLSSMIPLLAGRHHDGFGAGIGAFAGAALGSFFTGGRRGPFGDGGDGISPGQAAFDQTILTGINALTAAVPTTALETQAAITSAVGSLALGTQQGFANTKDSVQNVGAALGIAIASTKDTVQNLGLIQQASFATTNQNILTTGCSIERQIQNDGDKTRALLVARFTAEDQTRIASQAAEIIELREEGRRRAGHDELRLTISNNNTAVAAQQQGQVQAQQQQQQQAIIDLGRAVGMLVGDIQAVRQGQVIFNSGTMAASGTQAAANTKVG